MPEQEQEKTRSDAGIPRKTASRKPKRVSVYLAGHGVEAKIAKAIEDDVKLLHKNNPDVKAQDVVKKWLAEFLGYKEQ